MTRADAERLAPVILVALTFAAAVMTMTPWLVGGFYDDGVYVVLAKSLATGQGYRYLNLPGAPNATHYPPGYPLFLAALFRLAPDFPANATLLKFGNACLMPLMALGAYLLARRRLALSPWVAAGVVLLFAISIPVLLLSTVLMSELLFLALLFPGLLLCERVVEQGGARAALVAGLAVGALVLVRSIGVVLLPALLIPLAFRRRWLECAVAMAGAAALMVPWQLWVARHDGAIPAVIHASYGSYSSWMGEAWRERGIAFFVGVFSMNTVELLRPLRAMFSPAHADWIAYPFLAGMVTLFLAGCWAARRRAGVLALFTLGYLGVLTIWAFTPDRFLLAIWPTLGLLLAAGARWAYEGVSAARRAPRPPLPALAGHSLLLLTAVLVVVGHLRYDARAFPNRWWESAQHHAHDRAVPLLAWAQQVAPARALLSVETDPLIYLYSGRRTVPQVSWAATDYLGERTAAQEATDFEQIVAAFSPHFLLVRNSPSNSAAATAEFIRRHPATLRMVSMLPDSGAVYIVRREAPAR